MAVYTNSVKVTPLRAEEGLAGLLQPKPPLSEAERVSPSYPQPHHIDFYSDEQTDAASNFEDLDSEGRALVVDFGLFVLINVYCPAETTETRLPYKMNFHLLLQERVRKLIQEGREVIVLGDINVSATPLDHADGNLPSNADSWYEHPARAWMRNWLEPNGPMVDAIRSFWPDRKGMFTCKAALISRVLFVLTDSRLEHEVAGTRNELWRSYRLRARHPRPPSIDQARRHPAVVEGIRSLSHIHRLA